MNKRILLYYLEWLLPSSTALYIVLHDFLKWHMLIAYVFASIITGAIYYPLNKFIFSKHSLLEFLCRSNIDRKGKG